MAKPNSATLLFLFLSSTLSLLIDASTIVLDVNGDELNTANHYYIRRSSGIGFFGGLSTTPVGKSCFNDVIESFEVDPGRPAMFYPSSSIYGPILETGTWMNIEFLPTVNTCSGLPSIWIAAPTGNIRTHGTKGGDFTQSWFYLSPGSSDKSFQLYNCPCLTCKMACIRVGLINKELVLDNGLSSTEFAFVKVPDDTFITLNTVQ